MRLFPVWFLVVPLLAFRQSATAQGPEQDRAPRFLLALDSRLTPVDIERTSLLGRRLSLSLDGATIKEALREIGRQSGLELAYGDDVLPRDALVHLRAEGITVVAALTDVLFDTDIDVVFSPNGRGTLVRRPDPAQGGTVTGRVTDATRPASRTRSADTSIPCANICGTLMSPRRSKSWMRTIRS